MTVAELECDAIAASDITELMKRKGPDADGRFRVRVPMGRMDGAPLASAIVELDVDPSEIERCREWCERAEVVVRTIEEATAGDELLLDLCPPNPLYCTWLGRGVRIDMQGDGFEITNLDTAYSDVAAMLRKYAARCEAAASRLDFQSFSQTADRLAQPA